MTLFCLDEQFWECASMKIQLKPAGAYKEEPNQLLIVNLYSLSFNSALKMYLKIKSQTLVPHSQQLIL